MNIYSDINALYADNCVATVGMFDGLHCGHISILDKLKSIAKKLNLPTTVVTIWPHPKKVLGGTDANIKLLNTFDEKLKLFSNTGIDNLVILPFTRDFANISAEHFISDYLINKIHAQFLLLGYNHHFGNSKNQPSDYISLCKSLGLEAAYAPQFFFDNNIKCSSSEIRKYLSAGNVIQANKLLGYSYCVSGMVIHGDSIGSKINFPTANISLVDTVKLLPAKGVYATYASVGKNRYKSLTNIGIRPTLTNAEFRFETHILNFDGNLYDREITVEFVDKIRDEIKFNNLQELEFQISQDVIRANETIFYGNK